LLLLLLLHYLQALSLLLLIFTAMLVPVQVSVVKVLT
jgi:hypothetical protein